MTARCPAEGNQPAQNWRPGALRYLDNDGIWIVTEPRDALYSLATFLATEWWDIKTLTWRVIYED